jgi:hypothetical protein
MQEAKPVSLQAPEGLASRFFQLRLGKAPTGPYLLKTGRRADDKCWWCGKGAVQTRDHLQILERRTNDSLEGGEGRDEKGGRSGGRSARR